MIVPAIIGVVAAGVSLAVLGMSLDAVGIPSAHHVAHLDAYGDYREGGSTRAGFLVGLISLCVGFWAGAVFHTRRLDAGLHASSWRVVGFGLGALLAYTVGMAFLTVTFERETRQIPATLFNVLDLAVLVGCGVGAAKLYRRLHGE